MYCLFRSLFTTVLLFSLLAPGSASAKGGFDFIAVTGPGLKEEIRITEEALTGDFFAFADFYENRTEAPADPGPGYQVTRYYVQGAGPVPFDRLHYYPETGFVNYDGIAAGGSSEYDGGWYRAEPDMKAAFETALASQLNSTGPSTGRSGSLSVPSRIQLLTLIGILTGLAAALLALSWLRRPSSR